MVTYAVHVMYSFFTIPYMNNSTPGRTGQPPHPMGMAHSLEISVLTSNPMGIDHFRMVQGLAIRYTLC